MDYNNQLLPVIVVGFLWNGLYHFGSIESSMHCALFDAYDCSKSIGNEDMINWLIYRQ